jgi:glycine dehydrogenase subunit 2
LFCNPEKSIFPLTDQALGGFKVVGANAPVDAFCPDLPEREDISGGMSQTTEIDVVRHYTRLSLLNFDIDRGMYPLGSCTMKHNPRLNEVVAADPHWADCHPFWPDEFLTGHHIIMEEVRDDLKALSGFDEVSILPAAGAHGELTSTFMIKAYHEDQGNTHKKVILTPDTAHGTNPASAAMAGFDCKEIASGPDGYLRYEDVLPHLTDDVAALMVTNPNTLGIYEKDFARIAKAVHDIDGLIYMDGANFNAIMGVFQPGKIGADLMHWNLHKTFTTPHGGGGPGSGPIGFNEKLARYAPESDSDTSIGSIKAYFGQWGMFIRTWCYIRALGGVGLAEVTEEAIINANYLRKELEGVLDIAYETQTLHESVFTDKNFPNGVITKDLAKRLIDYGFHPPTVYFPIMVDGAIMMEPTETEPKHELDRFVTAIKSIVAEMESDPDLVKNAPHTTTVRRVDETRAARQLDLRWSDPQNS